MNRDWERCSVSGPAGRASAGRSPRADGWKWVGLVLGTLVVTVLLACGIRGVRHGPSSRSQPSGAALRLAAATATVEMPERILGTRLQPDVPPSFYVERPWIGTDSADTPSEESDRETDRSAATDPGGSGVRPNSARLRVVPDPGEQPGLAAPDAGRDKVGGSLLAGLRRTVELGQGGEPRSEAAVSLGRLPPGVEGRWTLAVDDAAARLNGARLLSGRPAGRVGTWQCALFLRPVDDSRAASRATGRVPLNGDVPCATVRWLRDGELALTVRAELPDPVRQQLGNCLLAVTCGNQRQVIQLREEFHLEPPVVNLATASGSYEWTVPNLPSPARCAVQIGPDELSDSDPITYPERRELRVNGSAELRAKKCQELVITLRLICTQEGLCLRIVPRIRMSGQDCLATLESIDKQITLKTSQLARNQRDLVLAKRRLKAIPGDAKKIRKIRPRTPNERGLQSLHLAVLDREAAKLQARVSRLVQTIPKQTAVISRLKQLGPIVKSLNGQVRIPLRLVARADQGEIRLAVAR